MPRTRRSDCSGPGIRRRRQGRGFSYLDERSGRSPGLADRERIANLAIPPAWREVWICADPQGHIQATGIDARGRKQYLYHPDWRARRDQAKFDAMLVFARRLPAMRRRLDEALAGEGLGRERVLACAVRLLDVGFFRIGGETYAAENDSYGLATVLKRHVSVPGPDVVVFDYPAKHGRRRIQRVVDPVSGEIVAALRRRRSGGEELLAYKQGARWRDVRSQDINDFIKEVTGLDASAKDFRTWNATVLAAVSLAVVDRPQSHRATERAIRWAVEQVAYHLGNTPAVARGSYIDPRVCDQFRDGRTIEHSLAVLGEDDGTAIQGRIERAVLRLLDPR
jgi:DNA topoisomerase IB